MLSKDTAIRDTLRIVSDYVAAYQCKVAASGNGHDLRVSADVYDDTLIHARLLRVDVNDSLGKRIYHYRINTSGGSRGRGGRGGSGGIGGSGQPPGNSGSDGMSGRDGFDGAPGQKGKVVFTAI